MHLVDEPRLQILTHGRYAAADTNVLACCCFARTLQRFVDSAGDEMKRCVTRHLERLAWMVREHEHRHVIRRVVAPPAFPVFVRPCATNRPKHVAAHDPCAEVYEAAFGECVISVSCSSLSADHLFECFGMEEP